MGAEGCVLLGQALVPLLSPLFQQRRYRKGEIMAEQGTPATTLFYIQSGECEVLHRLDEAGDEDFEDEVGCQPHSESSEQRSRFRSGTGLFQTRQEEAQDLGQAVTGVLRGPSRGHGLDMGSSSSRLFGSQRWGASSAALP